jgi:hypothetical protein
VATLHLLSQDSVGIRLRKTKQLASHLSNVLSALYAFAVAEQEIASESELPRTVCLIIASQELQLLRTGVAVEKLLFERSVEIASRQDVLHAIFSTRVSPGLGALSISAPLFCCC